MNKDTKNTEEYTAETADPTTFTVKDLHDEIDAVFNKWRDHGEHTSVAGFIEPILNVAGSLSTSVLPLLTAGERRHLMERLTAGVLKRSNARGGAVGLIDAATGNSTNNNAA